MPDPKIDALLKDMPERPPRSKLEEHHEVIRELRRKGRTYEEIAGFFAEHLQLKVAPSTIHAFVKVRSRRRNRPRYELPPNVHLQGEAQIDTTEAPAAKKKPLFQFNENEPLRLEPKRTQEP